MCFDDGIPINSCTGRAEFDEETGGINNAVYHCSSLFIV